MRLEGHSGHPPAGGEDWGLFRGLLGAELRLHRVLRLYGEAATGAVSRARDRASAAYENRASLQQGFAELDSTVRGTRVGARAGRQEFAEGPRQLLSVSDGPNLHRTWNGLRLYAHGSRLNLGAFAFEGTKLAPGAFDERRNPAERLRGLHAGLAIGPGAILDLFWYRTENPAFRSGARTGLDDRDTFGARLRGRRGRLEWEGTAALQWGRFLDRRIEAWALFAAPTLQLAERGWKPRLGLHLDLASGGGAEGPGPLRGFNPLYPSAAVLGEGLFLGASNLRRVAPELALRPTPATRLTLEWAFAWRDREADAVYGGPRRAYAGTAGAPGRAIGHLLRAGGSWAVTGTLSAQAAVERFTAGEALRGTRAAGTYGYLGFTWRY